MPARTGRYPDGSLVALLQHEVAHVLIARAARGGEVPRWFDEGLAMAASRDTQFGDRTRVALAVLTDSRLPLARIDATFAGGSSEVESAYALARDVVRELLERHGQDAGARILAGVARGLRFKEAFLEATGETLGTFETRYWDDRTFWDRWIPILTSSALLWGGSACSRSPPSAAAGRGTARGWRVGRRRSGRSRRSRRRHPATARPRS